MGERVRLINRLRWYLVTIASELEALRAHASARVWQPSAAGSQPRLRVARLMLTCISEIVCEERALAAELSALIQAHTRSHSTVTAAIIVGAASPYVNQTRKQRTSLDIRAERSTGAASR